MIIVMKPHATENDIESVLGEIKEMGYKPRVIKGDVQTVIGAVGDENSHQSLEMLKTLEPVEQVIAVQAKHKLASREFHPESSVVSVGGNKIGAGNFGLIAGPCGVESIEQMHQVCKDLSAVGVKILRGGAYKPRTSPYDFQGLGEEGLEILAEMKRVYGMAIVTELVGVPYVEKVAEVTDMIQIGARNCQNFNLLEVAGAAGKPVMLKRGMSVTVKEWLSCAEYLMVHGCPDVILCERGIRTFETATRNTLDLGAVAAVKKESHLPVIIDPSHAAGRLDLVLPLSKAGIAVGADGIVVESHPCPHKALSDAAQQIPSAAFGDYLKAIEPYVELYTQSFK